MTTQTVQRPYGAETGPEVSDGDGGGGHNPGEEGQSKAGEQQPLATDRPLGFFRFAIKSALGLTVSPAPTGDALKFHPRRNDPSPTFDHPRGKGHLG